MTESLSTFPNSSPGSTNLSSAEHIEIESTFGAHNYHPLDVVISRGEGVWVWDVEGRKYMDFLAAYSAVNQGHCHPKIVQTLLDQVQRLTLTSRAFRNDQLALFCKQLCEMTGFAKVLPMNSGAEAVETAIKAARKWAYTVKGVPYANAEILVFDGNFHGRTTTIVGFSSEEDYRFGFGPFTPGFQILPYGDAQAVADAITPNTAAVLLEPIQGEGGIIVPPEGYLKKLRQLTTDNNVLLITDEIQTGLGRTGRLFCYEHEGIRPDVVIVGKALAGGLYPVSAMLADDEVMNVFEPGQHGSTFGGNPLGTAIARTALKVLVEEGMIENSARLGEHMMDRLRSIDSPHIKEVRGRGLWAGIELYPAAGGARKVCEMLQEKGLLCKGTHEHVIRLAPPLVISREELDWALDQIEQVFTEL